ncbi:MAG: DNA polymerase I [Alphaproteobacteria bacterium]
MVASSKPCLLIDASGFIFRAFHALPPLTRADGTPVGAVLGFINMVMKLQTLFADHPVAVIFDAARRTFRHDIYKDYKANRPPLPAELIPQFSLVREAARCMGLPIIEEEGFEADDLIASYASKATAQGVILISSDKDLLQLLQPPNVSVYDPMRHRMVAMTDVIDKFGAPPLLVPDVQALAGDSSDNVPGVPGIGVKTAAQLILEYGNLEKLLENSSQIPQPKRRALLQKHADDARLSYRLVLLKRDVHLPIPLESFVPVDLSRPELMVFLQEQGFRSVLNRLGHDTISQSSPKTTQTNITANSKSNAYQLIQQEADLIAFIAKAQAAGLIAVDTETDSLTPSQTMVAGVSLAFENSNGHIDACYIPVNHIANVEGQLDFSANAHQAIEQINPERAMALLKPLLEDSSVLKILHNAKFDLQVFAQYGIDLAPLDDTMLMSYVVDGTAHGHGMDELAEIHLGRQTIPFSAVCGKGKDFITFPHVPLDKALAYAAEDADVTLCLYKKLRGMLLEARRYNFYRRIEQPLPTVVAAMEQHGVLVDKEKLAAMAHDFGLRMHVLEKKIFERCKTEFNLASPKQLGDVLFTKLQLPGGKKLASGGWSTDSGVLEPLAQAGIEVAQQILDWRQLAKLKSTYVEALPQQISAKSGRVHSSFSIASTNTGRFSSSDPNLQNIPIRTEDGKKIRGAFIAAPGHLLISADYSQVELRIVASIAGIASLRKAFLDGLDVHSITAAQVFDVELDAVNAEMRRKAKAINFGIIYGISSYGLGVQLGVSAPEAGSYIKNYFRRFPELEAYMESTKEFARQHGYVETLWGRKCFVPGIADKNANKRQFAERQAINARIQGTAADIMRKATINTHYLLKNEGLGARLIMQVHDELVLEVPEEEITDTVSLTKIAMRQAGTQSGIALPVPLVVETGIGKNWAEAH